MRALFIFAVVVLIGLSPMTYAKTAKRKLQTPKAAEAASTSGALMSKPLLLSSPPMPQSIVMPPRTNRVFKLNFAWDYDSNSLPLVSTFTFYMGTSPGVYDYWTNDIGTNLSYTFYRTNWGDERMNRHFFVVTAKAFDWLELQESLASNEVHYPPFPPDHIELSWSNTWDNVGIFSSTDLTVPKEQWMIFAYVEGTNTFSTNIPASETCRFFIINKPDVLSIRAFNPNP